MNRSGKLTQRHVRIVNVKNVYITGYCFNQRAMRKFITLNILGVKKVAAG